MVHEGVQHITRVQLLIGDSNWGRKTCQLILVQTFEDHNSEVLIQTLVTIPFIHPGALLKGARVFIEARNYLEIRLNSSRGNRTGILSLLELNQHVVGRSARELTAVINVGPRRRWAHQVSEGILGDIRKL